MNQKTHVSKMIVLQSTIQPFTNISRPIKGIEIIKEERRSKTKLRHQRGRGQNSVIYRHDQRAFKESSYGNTTSKG